MDLVLLQHSSKLWLGFHPWLGKLPYAVGGGHKIKKKKKNLGVHPRPAESESSISAHLQETRVHVTL